MNTDEKEHTRICTQRNRRAFLGTLGTVGLTLYVSGTRSGELPARQVTAGQPQASPEESWAVTLSAPDGAHPPFVSNSRRLLSPPELLDAPDEWVDRSLQWVDYILRTYPPGLVEPPPRRPALFRLDEVLHIESAPRKPLVQKFFQARLQRAIEEIEQTKVSEGMRIWRLYNHGALVRTPTASFTFDFVPGTGAAAAVTSPAGIGTEGFALSKEWLKRLAAQSDAHFISHKHPDHSNPDVVRLFMEADKPVVAPERLFPEEPDLSRYLTVPQRALHTVHTVPIRGGKSRLKVVTFPGHQGPPILNNVTLVKTVEDFTVLHTGDQSGNEAEGTDFDWLAQIGHYHQVDVLLTNGWANDLHRIVRGVNPCLVIPGHENEMTHAVPHREEYTQDYERMFGLHYPFIVMAWGENYLYTKPAEQKGVLPDEE
jgi:L-ascorbate metabolism protein UlaG (beta-lactamase superfamily)